MVILLRRKGQKKPHTYKGFVMIQTRDDIKKADKFDEELSKILKITEEKLIESGALLPDGTKEDVLKVWYGIGKSLNEFIKNHHINKEEEPYFWRDLYERQTLLHDSFHKNKIGETRNDYKMATILSEYKLDDLRRIGSWALCREIFAYKSIMKDKRIFDWVIKNLIFNHYTRDEARPFLKSVASRFKKMETKFLTDKDLSIKLKSVHPNE